jgi:hypothetical protein
VAEKQPVAIRVTRPYDSGEEFLTAEMETLTRTTVVLLGAQKRPDGVVLRFEITLANGTVLLRGEGRVVGWKEDALRGEPGLLLRFTRLDSKSKALVDRAAERNKNRRSIRPPPPPVASPLPPAPPPPTPMSTPSIDIPISVEVEAVQEAPPPAPPPPLPVPPPPPRAPTFSAPEISVSRAEASVSIEPPPDRDAILERLRTRAKSLDPAQIEAILKARSP